MHYLQTIYAIMQRARGLGYRALDNGTQLIGRVPHAGSQAWLHILFNPVSDSEIDDLESNIGIRFPEVFRDFLTFANGLSLFCGSLSIYGKRTDCDRTGDSVWQPFNIVTPNKDERLRDSKPSFLYVGGYPCGNGSYVYIELKELKVYRCSRQSSEPLEKWGSFPDMLISEANRLAGFFDESGRRLNTRQPVVT